MNIAPSSISGEELLWLNVLELGLRDFISSSNSEEIISWFFSKKVTEGSLIWICHILGLDEVPLKEGVLAYKKKYQKLFKEGEQNG